MEILKIIAEIVVPILAVVIAGIWTFFKLFHKFKTKFLFITNCQILHKAIWKDIVAHYEIHQNGEMDHAFRPLVLLPDSLKKYTSIKNGQKAVLECTNSLNENKLKVLAEVYWIPKTVVKDGKEVKFKPWNTINHPVFSLVLRRYFGIERPMYQDAEEVNDTENWTKVNHHKIHLDPLNKSINGDFLQWAASNKYTFRYFNPSEGEKGIYETEPNQNNFIEYCGLSIVFRTHSLLSVEND